MAGVWGANFGHLYPMLVPDDWWWRCFMRPIYLIPRPLHQLSWVKCHSENKIQKISEFVLLFILSNTFIGFVQFWSEGCPLQDIVWKGNQTLALVSVQSFCESHATHFHTQGKCPTNATIVTTSALLRVIWGSILRRILRKKDPDVCICRCPNLLWKMHRELTLYLTLQQCKSIMANISLRTYTLEDFEDVLRSWKQLRATSIFDFYSNFGYFAQNFYA